MDKLAKRYIKRDDFKTAVPVHVVWELTLACNLKCSHCGSRAGKIRQGELTTSQCFEVVESLKRLGTREITIIGGEAFLRPDWIEIIEKITQADIDCSMQTGAYNLTEERILLAKKAGIKNIGVSVDGLSETHNQIRGRGDSFQHVLKCLTLLKKHDIVSGVNTVITKLNKHELDDLLEIFMQYGIKNWQIQLAVAMGNAVDNFERLLIQPYEINELYENLIGIYRKALANGILVQAGNNIGYFGPYEHIWRQGNEGYYSGCLAGHTGLGIEADGKIKGCPSLPTTDYTGGNVKDMSLDDIWNYSEIMFFSRYRNSEELWGGCKNCYYADTCLAGCSWTSHSLFGRRGNNPFCHFRALELEKKGLKEKLVKIREGSGESFDYGLFEIHVLNENGNVVEIQSPLNEPAYVESLAFGERVPRNPKEMKLCKKCKNYIYADRDTCDFCDSDIEATENEYQENLMLANSAYEKLKSLLHK